MGRKKKVKADVPAQSVVTEDKPLHPDPFKQDALNTFADRVADDLLRAAESAIDLEPHRPLIVGRRNMPSPVSPRKHPVAWTPEIEDQITEMYEGGVSLTEIGRTEALPSYPTILRHIKDSESFRKKIEAARTVRALHFEERALEQAESALSKDDVPQARLAFDANVWAAEVNDPMRYGKKTTLTGDPSKPIAFTIVTGVPVADDAKTIELNADGTVKQDCPGENS
jgi:hypothetical protein